MSITIISGPIRNRKSRIEKICDVYSYLFGSKEDENVLYPLRKIAIGRVLCPILHLKSLIPSDSSIPISLRSGKIREGIVLEDLRFLSEIVFRTVSENAKMPGPQTRRFLKRSIWNIGDFVILKELLYVFQKQQFCMGPSPTRERIVLCQPPR